METNNFSEIFERLKPLGIVGFAGCYVFRNTNYSNRRGGRYFIGLAHCHADKILPTDQGLRTPRFFFCPSIAPVLAPPPAK